MARKTLRHPAIKPTHPGEMLREITIPATGLSKGEIAARLGVTRQSLYDLCREKQSVTPAMALRLGKLFGDGPEIWLAMQNAHDIWTAQASLAETLASIQPIEAAA